MLNRHSRGQPQKTGGTLAALSTRPDIYCQQQRPPNVGGAKRVGFAVFSSRPAYRRLSGCTHTPRRSREVAPAGLSPLVTAIMGRAKYDVLFRNAN